jgi:hypothetical protein
VWFDLVPTAGKLGAKAVLFVGVKQLWEFAYKEIRQFARDVLVDLAREAPHTHHLCLTVHGPNFGLDESEAFAAEIAGLSDAVSTGDTPEDLERITIIEREPERAKRLSSQLASLMPGLIIEPDPRRRRAVQGQETAQRLQSVGYDSENKPRVFVAMPFAPEMEDTFHYGIEIPVKEAGFLCERADLASFTGDVMEWVKKRIASCRLVIADLTGANPNVYLEVGYAWGCNKPTILLARDTEQLKFDTQGQRCLVYKSSIKTLEEVLRRTLDALRADLLS